MYSLKVSPSVKSSDVTYLQMANHVHILIEEVQHLSNNWETLSLRDVQGMKSIDELLQRAEKEFHQITGNLGIPLNSNVGLCTELVIQKYIYEINQHFQMIWKAIWTAAIKVTLYPNQASILKSKAQNRIHRLTFTLSDLHTILTDTGRDQQTYQLFFENA